MFRRSLAERLLRLFSQVIQAYAKWHGQKQSPAGIVIPLKVNNRSLLFRR